MKSIKYLLVLLTIVFLSGCSKQHIENIVLDELNTNLFPFFNPNGLKQMKEHGLSTYSQTLSNDSYQITYDIDLKNNSLTIELFGNLVESYIEGKNIEGCGLHDDSLTYCQFNTYNIKDDYLHSLINRSPLMIYTLNFNNDYLSTLQATNYNKNKTMHNGRGSEVFSVDYGNVNTNNDQNALYISEIIGTTDFSTLYLWYGKKYNNNQLEYYQYNIRYGGNSLDSDALNYAIISVTKE